MVSFVISFGISSSVSPIANFAAILAIGNPVAFEASAEDLLTLGFISIIIVLPVLGFTANWTLEPPVSTPIVLKHWIDQFLIFWYSLSDNVCAGATVTLSPVWIPIGSIFSMLHIIIALSLRSLTTSISYSFHPSKDSSIKTSLIGLDLNPISICFSKSSIL